MKNDLVFCYVGVVTLLKKIIAWNLSVGVDFDTSLEFLPPANEVCEGYVFTPVCHSVHRRAVCLSACWDTPPGSRHPLGADTPWSRHYPGADTPQSRHPPRADIPPCAVHAGRYGQQAGGMHPTGMHTRSQMFSLNIAEFSDKNICH